MERKTDCNDSKSDKPIHQSKDLETSPCMKEGTLDVNDLWALRQRKTANIQNSLHVLRNTGANQGQLKECPNRNAEKGQKQKNDTSRKQLPTF